MVRIIETDYDRLTLLNTPSGFWRGFPVVKGKVVFIKPNLVTPETAWDYWSQTRVELVEIIIQKLLLDSPAKIIIGECGFKNQWKATIHSTGYDKLLNKYPVELIPLQDGENYHKFTLTRNVVGEYRSLFGVKFSDFLLNSDVVINLPKMKVHGLAGITGAIKNMMGTMAQKGSMHPHCNTDILHKRLADLYKLTNKFVNFVVMDGVVGCEYMEQSGVPVNSKVLISSTNQWGVDVAAAKLMGWNPAKIPYLKYIQMDNNFNFDDIIVPERLIKNYEKPLKYRK